MREHLKDICAEAAHIIKGIIGGVFLVHLIYVVMGMAIFTPLIAFLGRILLYFSGRSMLSDMDIMLFALTPAGMLAGVLFGAVLVTIIVVEQASLMALVAGSLQGGKVGIVVSLMFTVSRAKEIFLFAFRLVFRVLIIIVPFVAISGAIAWLWLTDYDINYYLAEKPPVFMAAAALIAVVLVVMAVILVRKLLDWALALPLILLTDTTPADSFAGSRILTAGHRGLLVSVFLLWGAIIVLLEIILLGTVQFVGANLLASVKNSMNMLVFFLGSLAALISMGSFVITSLSSGSFAALLLVLARRCGLDINERFESSRQEKKTIGFRQFAFFLAGCAGLALVFGFFLMDGVKTDDDVKIIAHRGAAGIAPENTLASVKLAIEGGADWVEIDVQETGDGRIAVIHDSDLMKLAGNEMKIWDATLAQLQQVDIGSWFGPEFSGERIPTLTDVLETVKGRARLLIELKYYGHDHMLEQLVADIVEQTGMVGSVALMSLKLDGIEKAYNLKPDWSYGLLTSKTVGDISSLNMTFLAVNVATTSPGLIRRIHKAGKEVYVWTVNDSISMSRMMSLGVDGIITDEPELARQVLEERADMNFTERLLLHTAVLLGRPLPSKAYRDNSP